MCFYTAILVNLQNNFQSQRLDLGKRDSDNREDQVQCACTSTRPASGCQLDGIIFLPRVEYSHTGITKRRHLCLLFDPSLQATRGTIVVTSVLYCKCLQRMPRDGSSSSMQRERGDKEKLSAQRETCWQEQANFMEGWLTYTQVTSEWMRLSLSPCFLTAPISLRVVDSDCGTSSDSKPCWQEHSTFHRYSTNQDKRYNLIVEQERVCHQFIIGQAHGR